MRTISHDVSTLVVTFLIELPLAGNPRSWINKIHVTFGKVAVTVLNIPLMYIRNKIDNTG